MKQTIMLILKNLKNVKFLVNTHVKRKINSPANMDMIIPITVPKKISTKSEYSVDLNAKTVAPIADITTNPIQ